MKYWSLQCNNVRIKRSKTDLTTIINYCYLRTCYTLHANYAKFSAIYIQRFKHVYNRPNSRYMHEQLLKWYNVSFYETLIRQTKKLKCKIVPSFMMDDVHGIWIIKVNKDIRNIITFIMICFFFYNILYIMKERRSNIETRWLRHDWIIWLWYFTK